MTVKNFAEYTVSGKVQAGPGAFKTLGLALGKSEYEQNNRTGNGHYPPHDNTHFL
jgi:hypothetical protein